MKRLFSLLTGTLLVFLIVGNALAGFEYGAQSPLTMSVYNEVSNVETGYDFGIVDLSQQWTGQKLGTVDVSDTDSTVSVYSTDTAYGATYGLTVAINPGQSSSNILGFNSGVRDIWLFGYENGDSPVTIDATKVKSCDYIFKSNGIYSGIVAGGNPTYQPSLDPLKTDDYFDIYLYQWDLTTSIKGYDESTDYAALLRIDTNGNVNIFSSAATSAVPVPGSVCLLFSGMVGLIGLRRRNSAVA